MAAIYEPLRTAAATVAPPPARAFAGRPLLESDDLKTRFFSRDGSVRAVDGGSFHVMPGETLAIVGESGCGKSVTALSILRLVPAPPGRIVSGAIHLAGRDLLGLSEAEMRDVRGNDISMIFQEPMTSLNPVLNIGRQIAETLTLHQGLDRKAALDKAVEMLRLVHIPEAERRIGQYPHQLSGGMRQRVMIAMGLAEIAGTVPSLKDEIPGCPFAARCAFATDVCTREMPAFEEKETGHFAACFHSDRVARA